MSDTSGSRQKPNRGWFRKGCSGNPGGRPTVSAPSKTSAFEILLTKTLTITDHGVTREITMEEALQQRTYRNAVKGERMAMREVAKWIVTNEAWHAKHAPKAAPRKITQHISPDPDNADAAMMLLGIVAENPQRADIGADRAQLLLEPWAVQEALRRRRGGNRLTDRERDEIRRSTRDPDNLRWPRGTET